MNEAPITDIGVVSCVNELNKFLRSGQVMGVITMSLFKDGQISRNASLPESIMPLGIMLAQSFLTCLDIATKMQQLTQVKRTSGLIQPTEGPLPGG